MAEDQSDPGAEVKNPREAQKSNDCSEKQTENPEPRVVGGGGGGAAAAAGTACAPDETSADDIKELNAGVKEAHKSSEDDDDDKSDRSSRLVIDISETKEKEELKESMRDGKPNDALDEQLEEEEMNKEPDEDNEVAKEKPIADTPTSKMTGNKLEEEEEEEVIKEEGEQCGDKAKKSEMIGKRSKVMDKVENCADNKARKTSVDVDEIAAPAKYDDSALLKDTTAQKEEDKETSELEVGIVGMPMAVSELLSEEELATEKSTLPTDGTKSIVSERVVRWVEKTMSKANVVDQMLVTLTPTVKVLANPAEEIDDEQGEEELLDDEVEDEDEQEEEKDSDEFKMQTRNRKRKGSNGTNGSGGPSTRKSQKVVSSIIRRSIRW